MSSDRHANNFNLLRMLAATLVLLTHSWALAGWPEPMREQYIITLGSIAVDIFFVTSGFLVAESLLRRGSLRAFAAARALRIYPALIVAVLLTTLVYSLYFTQLAPGEFWTHRGTWSYLFRNITLLHPTGLNFYLPETLMNLPGANPPLRGAAVNGPLWSLVDETRLYACLALAFAAARWVHARWKAGADLAAVFNRVLAVTAAATLAWAIVSTGQRGWEPDFLHRFAMFFSGAALRSIDVRRLVRPLPALLALCAVLIAAAAGRSALLPVYTLCTPYLVLAAAYLPGGALREYNRLGDYSYGMYIYAWPVQQWTVSLWQGVSPWQVTAVALPCTLLLAVLSWHLVEKHMLALKSHWQPRPSPPPVAAQHA